MTQETLFGVGIGKEKDYDEMSVPERARLHNQRIKTKKRKGIIKISYSNYSTDVDEKRKKGQRFISLDFDGFNEGSACGYDSEEELDKALKNLVEEKKDYNLMIIDERIKQKLETPKEKYKQYCEEKGQKQEIKQEVIFEGEKIKEPIINIERRSDKSHLVYVEGHLGLYSKDEEGKEKEEIEKTKKYLIEKGFKESEIKIKDYSYQYQNDKPEYIEKKIKELL